MCVVGQILAGLEKLAPFCIAEDYDNVGLLLGDKDAEVSNILCVLDITEQVAQEAIEKNVQLIISHHPLIFSGIKNIDFSSRQGRILAKLIKADISVIAMHTNLDFAIGGLNDYLAQLLELENVSAISPTDQLFTLACYVPKSHRQQVADAIFSAGGGELGEYQNCCFDMLGQGSFLPKSNAQPFIGEANKPEEVEEVKLEIAVENSKLPAAISAMLAVHPYQQPAYQVIKNEIFVGAGFGRIGKLSKAISLEEFCGRLKKILEVPYIRVCGPAEKEISSVAFCTGAGEELFYAADKMGADVYISGDVKHHVFIDALGSQTVLIDAGHYYTELIVKNVLKNYLQRVCNELQYNNVNILFAKTERAPFDFV